MTIQYDFKIKTFLTIFIILVSFFLHIPLQATSSRTVRTKIQISSIESALTMFHIDMNRLPTKKEGLEILIHKPDDPNLQKTWDGPYLVRASALKDSWENNFKYIHPFQDSEKNYGIYSLGPDGKSMSNGNDSDDINSWTRTSWFILNPDAILYGIVGFFVLLLIFREIHIKRNKQKKMEQGWDEIHKDIVEWGKEGNKKKDWDALAQANCDDPKLTHIWALWLKMSAARYEVEEGKSLMARLKLKAWETDDPLISEAWANLTAPENLEDLEYWNNKDGGAKNPFVKEWVDKSIEECKKRRLE